MKDGHDVCVVGGGFAGFWSAVAARRVVGPGASILMISAGPTLQMRPRLYEHNPSALGVELEPLLALIDVGFAQEKATRLDIAKNRVVTADRTFTYERLVVATGSVMARPTLSGMEFAHSIDTQAEAIVFDERLAELAARNESTTVAVIGAGFVGIELALASIHRFGEYPGNGVRARSGLVDATTPEGTDHG